MEIFDYLQVMTSSSANYFILRGWLIYDAVSWFDIAAEEQNKLGEGVSRRTDAHIVAGVSSISAAKNTLVNDGLVFRTSGKPASQITNFHFPEDLLQRPQHYL
jgi:hypothetical protein